MLKPAAFHLLLVAGLTLAAPTAPGGASPAAAASPTRFLTGSEDVPLMEGLSEVADTRVVFDTPGGRIVGVDTRGEVDVETVRHYYLESLPALGWTRDGSGGDALTWRRDTEILEITVGEGADGLVVVRFELRPHSL
ncbi:hypothetical protein L2U69_17495 [Zavarzinia compransoris]|uniref:hypothetical protein n=1 Tax=Zavarzinia marina TaxID=2911065 RepID=UPI001F456308|nr:hypothetical protein [Zavarzinia marina]MCF4167446.1 hypothetical protein [Zavarzinia marina]